MKNVYRSFYELAVYLSHPCFNILNMHVCIHPLLVYTLFHENPFSFISLVLCIIYPFLICCFILIVLLRFAHSMDSYSRILVNSILVFHCMNSSNSISLLLDIYIVSSPFHYYKTMQWIVLHIHPCIHA